MNAESRPLIGAARKLKAELQLQNDGSNPPIAMWNHRQPHQERLARFLAIAQEINNDADKPFKILGQGRAHDGNTKGL